MKVRLSILLILMCCTPTGDTDETSPEEEKPSVMIQEPEIVPVTAAPVGDEPDEG